MFHNLYPFFSIEKRNKDTVLLWTATWTPTTIAFGHYMITDKGVSDFITVTVSLNDEVGRRDVNYALSNMGANVIYVDALFDFDLSETINGKVVWLNRDYKRPHEKASEPDKKEPPDIPPPNSPDALPSLTR